MKKIFIAIIYLAIASKLLGQGYHQQIIQKFISKKTIKPVNQQKFISLGKSIDNENWQEFQKISNRLKDNILDYNENIIFDAFWMLYKVLIVDYYESFRYGIKNLNTHSFWNTADKYIRSFYFAVFKFSGSQTTLRELYLSKDELDTDKNFGNIIYQYYPEFINLNKKEKADYLFPSQDPYSKLAYLLTIFQLDSKNTKSFELIEDLQKFTDKYPNFSPTYIYIRDISWTLYNYTGIDIYKEKQKLASFKAVKIAPNTPLFFKLEIGYFSREKDLEIENKVLKINPYSFVYRRMKIYELLNLGRIKEAHKTADIAIAMINKDTTSYDKLTLYRAKAILLRKEKKYQAAKIYLDKMIKVAPDNIETYRLRAISLFWFPKVVDYNDGFYSIGKVFEMAQKQGEDILKAEDWHYMALYLSSFGYNFEALEAEQKTFDLPTSEDLRKRIARNIWTILEKTKYSLEDLNDNMKKFLTVYNKEISEYKSIE